MIHPLLRLVATQPQLLADHAEAYAGLVSDEIGRSVGSFKQRMLLKGLALVLIALAVVLGGVALMLWSVMPPANLHAAWGLIAAPAVPAVVALVCLLVGREPPTDTFVELKQQLAADMAMLREVGSA